MPKPSGGARLHHALQIRPCIPIVLLTGGGDWDVAERALHDGAFSFLFKPIDRDELVVLMHHALALHDMFHRVQAQRTRVIQLAQRIKRIEGFYDQPHSAALITSEKRLGHEATLHRTVEQMRSTQHLLEGTSERIFCAKQERATPEDLEAAAAMTHPGPPPWQRKGQERTSLSFQDLMLADSFLDDL
jgi:response regulator RpfG family c-di-GMP phosphodiesterase